MVSALQRFHILKNICKGLFFNFFNGSLLHGPKGLRSRLYQSVRLQGLSHRSSFVFKSAPLILKQVPICIRKLKTNTFDKSIKFWHWLQIVSGCFRCLWVILGHFQIALGRFRSFQVVLDRFRLFQLVPYFSNYLFLFQSSLLSSRDCGTISSHCKFSSHKCWCSKPKRIICTTEF